MGVKADFFRRKDWQAKALIGLIVFALFGCFCVIQFLRFDNSKKNPRYTTSVDELNMDFFEDFEEEDLLDIKLPSFVICPTYYQGLKANISDLACSYVSGSEPAIPLTILTKLALPVFTPRNKLVFHDTCFLVTTDFSIKSKDYFSDYLDCTATTQGNAMIYLFSDKPDANTIPQDNTKWILVHQGVDSNIALKRLKRTQANADEESSEFEIFIQEQNDLPIDEEKPSVVFTIQYSFLGKVNQRGFYPYDFWIMLGTIGGTYIIFHAVFVSIIFCVFQFLNIKDSDEYETINEK